MKIPRLFLLLTLQLLALALHVALGEVDIAWGELLGALLTGGEVNDLHATIVKEVRVPRAMTAMVAGPLLGWLGLLMQTWFRNPLAGPGVLGITSGGSLGVALAVLLGWALPAWMSAAVGCLPCFSLLAWGTSLRVAGDHLGVWVDDQLCCQCHCDRGSRLPPPRRCRRLCSGAWGRLAKRACCRPFRTTLQVLLGMWMMRRAKWLDMWTLGRIWPKPWVFPILLHLEILLVTGLVLGGDFCVRPAPGLGHPTCAVFSPRARVLDAIQGIAHGVQSSPCLRTCGQVHGQHGHALALECSVGHFGVRRYW